MALGYDTGEIGKQRIPHDDNRREGPGVPEEGYQDKRDLDMVCQFTAAGLKPEGRNICCITAHEGFLGNPSQP